MNDRPAKAAGRTQSGGDKRRDHKRDAAKRPPAPVAAIGPDPGQLARRLAVELVHQVLERRRAFDDVLTDRLAHERYRGLAPRDRAFARLIAATVLRRQGELSHVIAQFINKPLPADRGALTAILLTAAAQLLALGTPAYAAVNGAVELVRLDQRARRFDKLANAVLRRVATHGADLLAAGDPVALNIPAWLFERWSAAYGAETARQIAVASLTEAALDLRPKADAAQWAEKTGGHLLATGSVRLEGGGRIDDIPGFGEGAWWVQDAAAALPAILLGAVAGQRVLDLCGAPGGKTAQLAAAGGYVTVVDISTERLDRVRTNLMRLQLEADLVVADAETWQPQEGAFDAVLLDAPCLATGTIRRHPDILHLKRPEDLAKVSGVQARILANAATLVKPGGRLVYCTCSLEPEECGAQIDQFLASNSDFRREPVTADDVAGHADWINSAGDLRTFPFHTPAGAGERGGMDGFYACRLVRRVGEHGQ